VRIVRKPQVTGYKAWLIRGASILVAIIIGAIIISVIDHSPIDAYKTMISTVFKKRTFIKILHKTIPLTIIALGTSVAFKMKYWNIGGEGQILIGAFCASYFALFHSDSMPQPLLLTVMTLAGFIGGGLYALIPVPFKIKFNTNETLFTLMLNYIALQFIYYLEAGPWRDPSKKGMQYIATFPQKAILPDFLGVHIGWVFALVLVVIIHILLKKTKLGYEISVIGESESTARYAGIKVSRVMLAAVFLSGGLCGLTGMIQSSALNRTLSSGLSDGSGFTGIIIAWIAQLSPIGIVITSFAFSILLQGGSSLETAMQIPSSIANILQGLILFCVLGAEFFINYKIIFSKKENTK